MWFRYRLRYRPKVSANLGFGFGIGPKPKLWFRLYTTEELTRPDPIFDPGCRVQPDPTQNRKSQKLQLHIVAAS